MMGVSISLFSQDTLYNRSIGLQANVYLDAALFSMSNIKPLWAIRYSYNYNKYLSVGPEFSGLKNVFLVSNIKDAKYNQFNLGGFSRFTTLPDRRICPFAEVSAYYQYKHFVPGSDPVFRYVSERIEHTLSGYIAPGVSIKSKSRKFSFDLMYKFSPDYIVNSKRAVFSYRINLHF